MINRTAADELQAYLANGGDVEILTQYTATGGEAANQWAQEQRQAQADGLKIEYTRVIDEFCQERQTIAEYEKYFHPSRKWRADAYLPEYNVLIEIDGGTWTNGRHNRAQGFEADCEKLNAAALLGYHVLRFTSNMVTDGRMAETLRGLCPF